MEVQEHGSRLYVDTSCLDRLDLPLSLPDAGAVSPNSLLTGESVSAFTLRQ